MGKKIKHQKAKNRAARKKEATAHLPPKPRKPKPPKPDPLAPPDFSIPKSLAQPVKAKGLRHAKWPALFKKHIGLLESHIRLVTRMQESLKSEMETLSEEQKREWELDELGNWRLVCEMLDRARTLLSTAKRTAVNLVSGPSALSGRLCIRSRLYGQLGLKAGPNCPQLPVDVIRDKKGLGLKRFEFELQGPKLAARAATEGYVSKNPVSKAEFSTGGSDDDSDTEEVDDGPSWHHPDSEEEVMDTTEDIDKHSMEGVERTSGTDQHDNLAPNGEATTNGKEPSPNPYFVIDTNPTPIQLNGTTKPKVKKRARDEDDAEQGSKKIKKEKHKKSKDKTGVMPQAAPTLHGSPFLGSTDHVYPTPKPGYSPAPSYGPGSSTPSFGETAPLKTHAASPGGRGKNDLNDGDDCVYDVPAAESNQRSRYGNRKKMSEPWVLKFGKKKIAVITYFLTLIQLIVFLVEIIKNGE